MRGLFIVIGIMCFIAGASYMAIKKIKPVSDRFKESPDEVIGAILCLAIAIIGCYKVVNNNRSE